MQIGLSAVLRGGGGRFLEAEGCPRERLVTIQNAIELPASEAADVTGIRAELGLDGRPIVAAVWTAESREGAFLFQSRRWLKSRKRFRRLEA
jgi:hypothetical protein